MLRVGNQELSGVASKVKYTSLWNGGAGTLEFEYPAAMAGTFPEGETVVCTYCGSPVFYGFLFQTEVDATTRRCVCYDQMRYFKAQGSLVREIETLSQFTERCAARVYERIRLGNIEETERKLGKYRFEGKSYYDMILQSIDDNEKLNGYHYTIRDNFGAIDLTDTMNLRLPLVIGDGSLATSFRFSRSIAEDVYNSVRLTQDSGRDVVVEDAENIRKWGRLVLCQKESGKNEVQMRHLAKSLLDAKNRVARSLQIEAVGDIRVMGGNSVKVIIGDAELSEWAVVRKATHRFESNYTMSLELELGRFAS